MPSNSETVKWAAFSNRDSQETQKKVSVLSREHNTINNNCYDVLNSNPITYDSVGSSTHGGKPILSLKGKMLDFTDQNLHKPFIQQSTGKSDEEQRMISFLEEASEMLNMHPSQSQQQKLRGASQYAKH